MEDNLNMDMDLDGANNSDNSNNSNSSSSDKNESAIMSGSERSIASSPSSRTSTMSDPLPCSSSQRSRPKLPPKSPASMSAFSPSALRTHQQSQSTQSPSLSSSSSPASPSAQLVTPAPATPPQLLLPSQLLPPCQINFGNQNHISQGSHGIHTICNYGHHIAFSSTHGQHSQHNHERPPTSKQDDGQDGYNCSYNYDHDLSYSEQSLESGDAADSIISVDPNPVERAFACVSDAGPNCVSSSARISTPTSTSTPIGTPNRAKRKMTIEGDSAQTHRRDSSRGSIFNTTNHSDNSSSDNNSTSSNNSSTNSTNNNNGIVSASYVSPLGGVGVDRLYDNESLLHGDLSLQVEIGFNQEVGREAPKLPPCFQSPALSVRSAPSPIHAAVPFVRSRSLSRRQNRTSRSVSRHRFHSEASDISSALQQRNLTGLTEGSEGSRHDLEAPDLGQTSDDFASAIISINTTPNANANAIDNGVETNASQTKRTLQQMWHLGTFGVLGSITREFSVRFFGMDCEIKGTAGAIHDFLTPLSSQICITAGGRTLQTGGALFRDLPSNIVGCFLLGLITPSSIAQGDLPLPWIGNDNPLQYDQLLQTALGVGFCGCLTSFASWNSQMVAMLDGTDCVLGSQIPTAIFGYLLGVMASISAFHFGSHMNAKANSNWQTSIPFGRNAFSQVSKVSRLSSHKSRSYGSLHAGQTPTPSDRWFAMPFSFSRKGPTDGQSKDDMRSPSGISAASSPSSRSCNRTNVILRWGCGSSTTWLKVVACFAVVLLLSTFAFVGYTQHVKFYRDSFYVVLLTPMGVIARWSLSKINNNATTSWFPLGTFVANALASCISISCAAYSDRYGDFPLCFAIQVGLAGSLSTVSTFVKEIAIISRGTHGTLRATFYAAITIVMCMALSLSIYSPIVRHL